MKSRTLKVLSLATVLFSFVAARGMAQDAAVPPYLAMRDVAHGSLKTLDYRSKSLNREREAIVYLPPGYDGNAGRFPVLYLLHGARGDQHTWIDQGHANVILDNLIADGRLKPLIVVMPYGYTTVRGADEPRRGPADYKQDMEEFVVDFIDDLIPLVESRYRAVADHEHRAIAGLSMGGGQTLAIGLSHPDMFSRIASFSAAMQIANSPDWGGLDFDKVLADADALNDQVDFLWVGCGTDDTLFNVNQAFSEQLSKHGVEHIFRVTRGAHTMEVWQRDLYEVAPQLF